MNRLPNIQLGPVDWVTLILVLGFGFAMPGLALRARAAAKRSLSQ